jgi:hypothetical protein
MLRIVDLSRAEELSSPGMARVVGGMSCDTMTTLGGCLGDLRDAFNSLGCYGAGNALDDQQQEVYSQRCAA